jgi:hypothetical protein
VFPATRIGLGAQCRAEVLRNLAHPLWRTTVPSPIIQVSFLSSGTSKRTGDGYGPASTPLGGAVFEFTAPA